MRNIHKDTQHTPTYTQSVSGHLEKEGPTELPSNLPKLSAPNFSIHTLKLYTKTFRLP